MRRVPFVTGQVYHVFNRGTEKRKVFLDNSDYQRFLLAMDLMNDEKDGMMIAWRDFKSTNPSAELDSFLSSHLRERKPLVSVVCYSLLPNHFHLVLRQDAEGGIGKFMRRAGIGYTLYFNEKYKHSGVLFQGRSKSALIKSTVHLQYLSAYVNMNCEIHGIARAEVYRWSSFPEYIRKRKKGLCREGKKITLGDFKNGDDYKSFAKKNAKHFREKKLDEKMILENPS